MDSATTEYFQSDCAEFADVVVDVDDEMDAELDDDAAREAARPRGGDIA